VGLRVRRSRHFRARSRWRLAPRRFAVTRHDRARFAMSDTRSSASGTGAASQSTSSLTKPDRGQDAGARRRRRPPVSQNAGSTTRWRDRQNRDRDRMVTPLTRERGGSRAPSDLDMLNPQSRASRLRAGSARCHRRPRGCFGSRRGVPSGSSARSNASHARLRKRSVGRRSSREPVDLCLSGFQFTSVGQPAGRRDGYGCERSARARVVPITA
jgi:hypothetical protein